MQSLFTTTITVVKFSILGFYRSLFTVKLFHQASAVLAILCFIWFLVCFFVDVFQCNPVRGAWDLTLVFTGQAQCLAYGTYIVGYEITNTILDIAILVLPIRTIWTLQLSGPKKFVIGGIFALGGL